MAGHRMNASALAITLAAVGALASVNGARADNHAARRVDQQFSVAPGKAAVVKPSRRANRFVLAQPGGGRLEISFGECNSAAVATCANGVSSIDHDEESGSCSFTCFAAND